MEHPPPHNILLSDALHINQQRGWQTTTTHQVSIVQGGVLTAKYKEEIGLIDDDRYERKETKGTQNEPSKAGTGFTTAAPPTIAPDETA